MKKLLFVLATCLAVAASSSFSLANLAPSTGDPGTAPQATAPAAATVGSAAVRLPAAMPRRDRVHPDVYGYRSSNAIARSMRRAANAAASAAGSTSASGTGSASSTVTVTAIVLPVRTVVVHDGTVTEIWSNTPDRRVPWALWTFRADSVDGAPIAITRPLWKQVRTLMLAANTSTGQVY